MHKLMIITALLFSGTFSEAQELEIQKVDSILDFQKADSITEACYSQGKWDELIQIGNKAIDQQIDYKKLRQRIGYAYFVKANYYAAQNQYEKALAFDESDSDTKKYLYYIGLYTGDNEYAQYRASKLDDDTQKKLGLKSFKILQAVDMEYNYKVNDAGSRIRSNPYYYRIGINTQMNYRLNLYQSVSQYNQTVNETTLTIQNEYYGSLDWILNSRSTLKLGYHYVNTIVENESFKGKMFVGKFTTQLNRFNYGTNASILSNLMGNYYQVGVFGGVNFPGNRYVYLKSSLNCLIDSISSNLIFTQFLGLRIFKPLWVEGSITFGNLKNYNDNDGLYLYNSLDATTFRTGATFYYLISKNITFVGNYTYDSKEILSTDSNTKINYNQHSFSGGIIWKI